jgi:hypothetical protein
VAQPHPAFAYLKFGYEVNATSFTLKWRTLPVRYYVSDVSVPSVTQSQFQAAADSAFKTWASVPTASLSYQFMGFTRNLPGDDDGRTTLGFRNEPSLDRVLASTSYLVDGVTGDWYCKFDTFHPAVDNNLPVTRVISRVTLQGILAGGLPESCILNNCKVASYEEDSDGITAVLEDGRRFKGDVLIGADGACPQRARAWRVR